MTADTTAKPGLRRAAAVVGIGHTDWVGDWARARAGEKPADSYGYGLRAFNAALAEFFAQVAAGAWGVRDPRAAPEQVMRTR